MDAVVIVDGLNLHHALLNFGLEFTRPDILKLGSKLLERRYKKVGYQYFTSAPQHKGKEAMDAYLSFTEKLRASGVVVSEGRFQKSVKTCHVCQAQTVTHKEKETDVALALKVIESAMDPNVREILLISADSDLAPALKFAKRINPKIRLVISQTSGFLRYSPISLGSSADAVIRLRPELINSCQFSLD